MATQAPDVDLDPQDMAEVFDETHLTEDADEFATLDEALDVYDFTSALGDARESTALDAAELDPDALEDEDVDVDQDVDDRLDGDLEDEGDNEDVDAEDVDSEDGVVEVALDDPEVETVAAIDQLPGPRDEAEEDDDPPKGTHPDDVPDDSIPHQEDLLDEGVEETFPASDPVSVKRIT